MKLQYAAIFLLMFSCNHPPENKISLSGNVTSFNHAEIKSEVEGKLLFVHFEDGQTVNEGDILFTIDPKAYQAKFEIATSQRLQNISKLQYAAEKVDRYKKLLKANYVTEIDSIQYISELTNLEATVMQNEIEIRLAKSELDKCIIKAPFTGVTGKRAVDAGNMIQNDHTTLVQLNQIDPIYIDFSLTEKEYNQMISHPTSEIVLTHPYDKSITAKASLTFVDNAIHENKILLRAKASNPEYKFWPGQAINITILLD